MKKEVCPRCAKQKFVYKINGGYSLANIGGERITCPLCQGEGMIDSELLKPKKSKRKTKKVKEDGVQDNI